MKWMCQLAVVGVAVLTLACDNARRDESANNGTTRNNDATVGTAGVSNSDRDWVQESMSANMAEIELAKLAQDHAASNDVKQYAQMMIRDHTKAGDELKQIAQKNSITVVSDLNDEHRDLMQKLSGLRGAEFDDEYMDAMVDSHQEMINHLQSKASEDRVGDNKGEVQPERADNPVEQSLNQWAANTLPTARHHLDEARRINDALDNRQTTGAGTKPGSARQPADSRDANPRVPGNQREPAERR